MRDRLTNIAWRSLLAGCLFVGVWWGAFKGAEAGSLWSGVGVGVSAGFGYGLFAVLAGRHRGDVTLPNLSDADRATVMRTIREGSVVGDARLAPAVIAYTEAHRDESRDKWESPRVERGIAGFFVLVSAYFAIDSRLDGNNALAVLWVLVAVVIVTASVVGPRRRERKLKRLERVEHSARAFLEAPW